MRRILFIYIIITSALVFNITLDIIDGISLRGYWGDRILFWVWLISTLILIIKGWNKKGVKIYTWSLVALLGLSLMPLLIPFTIIIMTGFGLDRTYGKGFNDNLRIQVSSAGFIGRPNVEVISQNGIYEKLIGQMSGFTLQDENHNVKDLIGIKILEEQEERVLVEFLFSTNKVKYWLDKK